MKKKVVLLSVLCIALLSCGFAQKCKYDYNKVDEFSGTSSKGITVKFTRWFYIGMNKNGATFDSGASIILNGEYNQFVEKGDSLMLKLASGEVISLYSMDRYAPINQVVSAANGTPYVVSRYDVKYAMTEELLELLQSATVTHVRMIAGGYVHDEEVSEKEAEKIRSAASCILQ